MYRSLVLIAFVASSCAPAYLSNTRNTPMFSEAREFAGTTSVGSSGLDVQLAYAVTNHIAVMANGNIFWSDATLDTIINYRRTHRFAELGIGYFVKKERFHFELFGGYGRAKVHSYQTFLFKGDPRFVNGVYDRIFFQPSFRLSEKRLETIFSPRFSIVNFRKYTLENIYTGAIDEKPFSGTQGFFEPSFTERFRIVNNLYGFAQVGFNIALNDNYYYDHNGMNFSVGLQLRAGPKHGD